MQTVSIAQLKHFLLVVECGSYHQAAEKAFRSQSAISRSIQELELRLGARLFQDAKRVELSPKGHACLPVVRELVAHFDRAIDTMDRIVASEHGTLSIGGTSTVATRLLPEIVSAFRKQHPQVELRLVDDNSDKLRDMVKSGELDLALCSLLSPDPKLHFSPLLHDAFGFVCGPSHPMASRPSLDWQEIIDQPLIRTTVHDHLRDTPAQPLLNNSKLFVSTMISVWALLKAGEGVTVLPALSAPDPDSGLVYVPLKAPVLHRSMGLLRLLNGNTTPASGSFEVLAIEQAARLARRVGFGNLDTA